MHSETIDTGAVWVSMVTGDVKSHITENRSDGSQTVETLEDVLKRPLEEEPSKLEKRAAIKVVSRILHQNETSTCTLSTGELKYTQAHIVPVQMDEVMGNKCC